ncbi:MAG TPA: cob(I)yrinic acid a,c-diamide adenosyltransferase [Methylophilaceae bacterium]|nr:cob(I)yrinic acid a,c-diamide adenosyltransferase [Methylophilaceae bacterium]
MGNRLSKIYTRTGDKGTTGLGDGTRVDKDSLRVEAMGEVDELNAIVGILLTEPLAEPIRTALTRVQHDLFDLGGELCIPGHSMLKPGRITDMEQTLDLLNEPLPPLKEFILPGGSRGGAYCHLARTVCRRAERKVIRLAREEQVSEVALQYLNRLSDLLFVMCRVINRDAGYADVLWKNES